ncbi:AmmeMemoRadiSam system protein B [bacterium]|nr:AmmeMemoRadiSam system protein B [candidate division CSSED10-310 bacterium]
MRILKGVAVMMASMLTGWFGSAGSAQVRSPAVAGTWYPDDAEKLAETVDQYLLQAENPEIQGDVVGLVAPHAGFVYSGPVAAHSYKLVQGRHFDTVVLLGNAHRVGFRGAALDGAMRYRTPLGEVPVDIDFVKALASPRQNVSIDSHPHLQEHSLEAQIPFLQRTLAGRFKIVPVLFGVQPGEAYDHIVKRIGELTEGKSVLFVASTDLTHFPSYGESVRIDQATVEAIAAMEPAKIRQIERKELSAGIPGLDCVLCGDTAVFALIDLARNKGADHGVVLNRANSGDVPFGDRGRVVGYGAVAFFDRDGADPKPDEEVIETGGGRLDETQRTKLLGLARHVLETSVRTGKPPVMKTGEPVFLEPRGVFVTLKIEGNLRGCIGYILPRNSLFDAIVQNTVNASAHDPRFPPVEPDELDRIDIEVSVLTVPEPVKEYREIEAGRHGIILKKGSRQAVFLPQVASEQGWDLEETLRHLSFKAGLPADAWKSGCEFEVFEAEVFGEKELGRHGYSGG